jgi:hypothetical protein
MERLMTEKEAKDRMEVVFDVFLSAVKAGGSYGAPGGLLYAPIMDRCSLDQFNAIMRVLVARGKVRKSGDRYFAVSV